MSDLYALSGSSSLNELEVYVKATVVDPYFEDKVNGSFITTLYDPRIKLKFLGKQPRAFKPNAPYTTYVAVSQQDGTPLPYERAINSYVRIRVETSGQASFSNQSYIPIGPSSIVSYTFTPEPGTQFISVSAILGENGNEDPGSLVTERAIVYRSPSNSYIYVSSSTHSPQVGDYMIFTVKVCMEFSFSSFLLNKHVLWVKKKNQNLKKIRKIVQNFTVFVLAFMFFYFKQKGESTRRHRLLPHHLLESYHFHGRAHHAQQTEDLRRRSDARNGALGPHRRVLCALRW